MEKLTKFKSFTFDKAQYQLVDASGNKSLLKIDYKNNSYKIVGILDENATEEISKFASAVLLRKHGVNFANI
jgi:hypothetical protein